MRVSTLKHMVYTKLFPAWASPRDYQLKALESAIDALKHGVRHIILRAPTGSGKSVIAYAVSEYVRQSSGAQALFLTPQIMLQEQYAADFPEFPLLKGRARYPCDVTNTTATDCVLSTLSKKLRDKFRATNCSGCEYRNVLDKVRTNSSRAILNFHTFLYHLKYASTFDTRYTSANFPPLDNGFVILDEAHKAESCLLDFGTIRIRETNGHTPPKHDDAASYVAWLNEMRCDLATHLQVDNIKGTVTGNWAGLMSARNIEDTSDLKAVQQLLEQIDGLKSVIGSGWVCDHVYGQDGKRYLGPDIRPLTVKSLAAEMLGFEQFKYLYMSATLQPNIFADSLGIKPSETCVIDVPSKFPVKQRPCLRDVVGSMSKRAAEETLPKLMKKVNGLLAKYDRVRVVIHTVSGALAKDIYDRVDQDHIYRVILHSGGDKSAALGNYESPLRPNAVIISPSLSEGYDGKDSKVRVNIIVKVSFPYLGDSVVKRRAEEEPAWYAAQAINNLVQQYGRAVRHPEDYGITYILDADFNRLYTNNRDMFPDWFQSAVALGDAKLGILDRRALI